MCKVLIKKISNLAVVGDERKIMRIHYCMSVLNLILVLNNVGRIFGCKYLFCSIITKTQTNCFGK